MHARDQRAATALQPVLRAALHHYLPNVIVNVELGIGLPRGISEVKGGNHDALPVTRNQRQARFDVFHALLERNFAVENGYAADMQRRLWRFQIKENSVFRPEAVPGMGIEHTKLLQI